MKSSYARRGSSTNDMERFEIDHGAALEWHVVTRKKMRLATLHVASALIAILGVSATPAAAQTPPPETVVYFHTDAAGSVRSVTDATGQEVSRYYSLPFGEEWTTAFDNATNRLKFTGKERDADTGL